MSKEYFYHINVLWASCPYVMRRDGQRPHHIHLHILVYSNVSTKGKVSSFLTSNISYKQPSSLIGMGSLPSTRNFHNEQDDIYRDLSKHFLYVSFASIIIHKPKYGILGSQGLCLLATPLDMNNRKCMTDRRSACSHKNNKA